MLLKAAKHLYAFFCYETELENGPGHFRKPYRTVFGPLRDEEDAAFIDDVFFIANPEFTFSV